MTGKMKEKLIQCHNERPMREITSFSKVGNKYVPDSDVYCVMCGKQICELTDQLSVQEFVISGMCQECQDLAFGA